METINFNNLPEAIGLLLVKVENLENLLQQKQNAVVELPDRIDSIEEACSITGLGKSKIYKLTSTNGIPHKLMGNRLVFSRSELLQWLEAITVNRQSKSKAVLSSIALSAAKKTRRV